MKGHFKSDGRFDITGHCAIDADRCRRAFDELLKAFRYANSLNVDGEEFAVEIQTLDRLDVSPADLRWLILNGYLCHKREVTTAKDFRRVFEAAPPLKFSDTSCFVLTATGFTFMQQLHDPVAAVEGTIHLFDVKTLFGSGQKPRWDKRMRQLKVADIIVKHFRWPAPNQERILQVFEEDGWPTEIDDPLVPYEGMHAKERLHDTIKGLNRHQKIHLIQFRGNGTGEGVLWQYVEHNAASAGTTRKQT